MVRSVSVESELLLRYKKFQPIKTINVSMIMNYGLYQVELFFQYARMLLTFTFWILLVIRFLA